MKKLTFLIVAAVAFAFVGCRKPVTVSFSTTTQEMDAQGGSFEVVLTSNGEWSISETSDWITVDPHSGNGGTTLTINVENYMGAEARQGIIKATTKDNSAELTVTQRAPMYYVVVNPTSIACGPEGGEYSVQVTSNIEWEVTAPQWINCSVTTGVNNEVVTLSISPIAGEMATTREGDVVIGNAAMATATVHVVQTINPVLGITVTPNIIGFECTGETKTALVSTEDSWTASTEADWVTLSMTEGTGDATVSVTVGENPVYVDRQALVVFTTAGDAQAMLTIKQEASPDPHFLEVDPHSFQFGKEGGQQTINVGCDTDWVFEINEEWLSVSPQTGSGNATVTITALPNTVMEPREAHFKLKSNGLVEVLSATQEAGDEQVWVELSPDTLYVAYTGTTSAAIEVTSNSSWMLAASDWISNVPTQAMQGNATVYLIVDQNSSEEPRIGFVSASHNGQVMDEIVVVQEGKPDLLETDITEMDVRPEGADFTFHVTSNQNWLVVTDVDWMSCLPTSGFGSKDVTVTVQPLVGPRPRTGVIRVKAESGKTVSITVTQNP